MENITNGEFLELDLDITHCVKSVQIRSFSGPYFPVFGLNTEIYGVNHADEKLTKIMLTKSFLKIENLTLFK